MSRGPPSPIAGSPAPPRVGGWRAGIPLDSPPAPYAAGHRRRAPRREEGDAGEERVLGVRGQGPISASSHCTAHARQRDDRCACPMTRGVRALRLSRRCPASTVVGFDRGKHAKLCLHAAKRAEHAFAHKSAVEFPGPVSRARQCAHLDAFRDLVAGVLHEASRQGHLRRRKRDTRPITASTITMITTMVQSMTRPFRGERVQLAGGPPGHPRSTRELWRLW